MLEHTKIDTGIIHSPDTRARLPVGCIAQRVPRFHGAIHQRHIRRLTETHGQQFARGRDFVVVIANACDTANAQQTTLICRCGCRARQTASVCRHGRIQIVIAHCLVVSERRVCTAFELSESGFW